jgi:hypothetical protein
MPHPRVRGTTYPYIDFNFGRFPDLQIAGLSFYGVFHRVDVPMAGS